MYSMCYFQIVSYCESVQCVSKSMPAISAAHANRGSSSSGASSTSGDIGGSH